MEELMRKTHGAFPASRSRECAANARLKLTRGLCDRSRAAPITPNEKPSRKALEDACWATRLTEVAQAHAEHGCRRLYDDYARDARPGEDEFMNYKRFRRIYRLANLQIGRGRRRGRAKIVRGKPLRRATKPFEGWTLDFMHDRLFGGRAFRTLSMEDEFSRSGLALELSFSFPSRSVIAVLVSEPIGDRRSG
jgi:putative transposase